jgi:hypothetical protein
MAKFMGFSNTEIGLIMSTFGIDRHYSLCAQRGYCRQILASQNDYFGDDRTGLLGLIMTTYPPLWVMLCSGRLCHHHHSDAVVRFN